MSWIAVAISLAVILGIQAHKSFAKYADYNHILKEEVFQNDGRGYLNMGLWMERDLADLEGDDDEIVQSIYDAIDKANSLELSSDAVPNFSFKDAQERMYQLFFCLGEFKSKKKLKVLETGPGSCEHYLLWDEWGMRTENSCFEKYTEPSVAFLKGQKAARKGSSLSKVQRFQRLAETVGDNGEKYDRIVAVESAFHYPDRAGFFQKCYDALNPGGKLIMTDLVSNPDYSQNALWDFVWGYYWQKVLTTPKENSSVDMHEYEEQIRSCGFSKVVVIDITALALINTGRISVLRLLLRLLNGVLLHGASLLRCHKHMACWRSAQHRHEQQHQCRK